ncbi:enoyl-CoA hydratase/isomerase family protein [Natrinema gelatinilyticum]|uniref:enoyl-CoA hydratase/isomerase family protein n=1 Tax=Natrinema gelatinilyticum TaxID=2961571 RepID=UPI0020C49BBF|nr:enoyl-CoA hydratase-related protein [Natrinema gelatinilyticum]
MSVTLTQEPDRPHVAHLRLDANELNLLSLELAHDVRDAIESTPAAVSVLTIAASQPDNGVRGLTAGLDLEWARDLTPHEGQDLLVAFYDMIQAIRDLEAVTVCGCGTYTLGVGFELAMACEFRVTTDDATLGLPEVNVGLPTVIHGGLLLRLVGEGIANELIYRGDPIDGARASELGIVTDSVAVDEYTDTMDDLVSDLAVKSPHVLTLQKRVMNRFRSNGLESGMAGSIGDIGRAFGSYDQREAMAAFLEDREPEFEEP